MSIVSRATLKGYFNDGDQPSVANHVDLIDSFRRADDEEAATATITAPTAGDSVLLLVADRDIKLTSFRIYQTGATLYSYGMSLKRNSGGVITSILARSADSPTLSNPNITTTEITEVITNANVSSGDVIYFVVDSATIVTNLFIKLRYK